MLAESATWIRVADATEAHSAGGIWLWRPHVVMTPGDHATLQREGWERIDSARQPALLDLLHGQLAPIVALQAPKADHAEMWAQAEDIRRALASPVVLAFGIPPEAKDWHQAGEVQIAQPLPPPWLGIYGLAVLNASAGSWSSTVYHYRGTGDESTIALREQLRDALQILAGDARWPEESPYLELCMRPDGYEQLSREITTGLRASTRDEEREEWHQRQAGLDSTLAQASALKAQRARMLSDPHWWEQEWEKIHEMATRLADAYWRTHQTATKPRKLPQMANIFDQVGQTQVPSAHPILTITQAQAQGRAGTGWAAAGDYPTFQQRTDEHNTALQVRPTDPDTVLDETTIAGLWAQVSEMSDLDADVLLAMIAQWMHSAADENGYVWITGDHILDYRGIQPMTKREEGGRRAGHREEDMIAISRCVSRQSAQWVVIRSLVVDEGKGRKGKSKKRLYTHEARLTDVAETIRRHELLPLEDRAGAPSYGVAWRYRPGTWLERFIEGPNWQMAWLCQQTLRYDPYHEQWEKRLARYLMFHLRINAKGGGGSIVRGVGRLIRELDLSVDERNPQRTRDRFEQAMDRLASDGQIESWQYTDNSELPPRKWLETWLERSVRITAAPLTRERYSNIPEHARQQRDKAAMLQALRAVQGPGKRAETSDA